MAASLSGRVARAVIVALGVATLAVGGWHCGSSANENDVLCEEAVAHATSCCPELAANDFRCHPQATAGCLIREPVLDVDQSRCVADEDCDTLRAHDGCARLEALVRADAAYDGGGGASAGASVCP